MPGGLTRTSARLPAGVVLPAPGLGGEAGIRLEHAAEVLRGCETGAGDHFGHGKDFDKEKKNGIGYTLRQRRIDALAFTEMGTDGFEKKISDIDDLSDDIKKIFYYDDVNDKEYILWERD